MDNSKKSADELIPQILLDGDLSVERFDQLIGIMNGLPYASTEHNNVDFKSKVVTTKPELAEFSRDIAAFANSGGGYLLIGVDKDKQTGEVTVVGLQDDVEIKILGDPTPLHEQIAKYLSPVPQVFCNIIPRSNRSLLSVLIFVKHFDSIPITFHRDANESQAHALYVRRGAATVPASKDDWLRIIAEVVDRQSARWTRQVDSVVQLARDLANGMIESNGQNSIEVMDKGAYLSPEVPRTSINLIRFRVQENLEKAQKLIDEIASAQSEDDIAGKQTELTALFDLLTRKSIDQIKFKHDEGLREFIEALRRILDFTYTERLDGTEVNILLAETALPRLYAIGLACFQDNILAAPIVIQQPIDKETECYGDYWHRCLMTTLYQAERIKTDPITIASEYISEATGGSNTVFLSTVSQFDYLRCLISRVDFPGCEPLAHFALREKRMVEPLVKKLISDKAIRASLLNITSDDELAALLWQMDDLARGYPSGRKFPFLLSLWYDKAIESFFEQHPRPVK